MAFNGSGVFLRVMNWQSDASSNIKIRADRHDQEDNNLAAGLTQCITKDGQTTITANLPMSGYRHTGAGNGQARNDYATVGQVQDGSVSYAAITGSANTYVMSPSIAITSYVDGQIFWGRINATNTGASTLNVSGLGAKSIKSFGTNDVVSGELTAGKLYGFQYDGTNFVIVSSSQFTDSGFNIVGSTDATKKVNFEVDGLTTGTTRTLTVPDASGTLYVSGGTDVAVADGGTGASTAAAARANLSIRAGSSFSNLVIANNSGTPNKNIDVSASRVVLQNATGDAVFHASASVTIVGTTTGANGLDTGTLSNSTWYYVYLISDGTTIAGLASLSATSPTLPSGYTYFYRVGAFITDGSANFKRIKQIGNEAQYKVTSGSNTASLPNIANGTAGTFSATTPVWASASLSLITPQTAQTGKFVIQNNYSGGTSAHVIAAPNGDYGGPQGTNPCLVYLNTSSSLAASFTMSLESSSIYWSSNNSNGGIYCLGWIDNI